jgi:hypothetical protein
MLRGGGHPGVDLRVFAANGNPNTGRLVENPPFWVAGVESMAIPGGSQQTIAPESTMLLPAFSSYDILHSTKMSALCPDFQPRGFRFAGRFGDVDRLSIYGARAELAHCRHRHCDGCDGLAGNTSAKNEPPWGHSYYVN